MTDPRGSTDCSTSPMRMRLQHSTPRIGHSKSSPPQHRLRRRIRSTLAAASLFANCSRTRRINACGLQFKITQSQETVMDFGDISRLSSYLKRSLALTSGLASMKTESCSIVPVESIPPRSTIQPQTNSPRSRRSKTFRASAACRNRW